MDPTNRSSETTAPDELAEARAAQRARLEELAVKLTRGLLMGPGPLVCGIFLVQAIVRGEWQLWALTATSGGMWLSWTWAFRCAKRGDLSSVAAIVFFSVFVHDTAALSLRHGGFGATALAAIGIVVIVWLLSPASMHVASWLTAAQLAALRVLDLTGWLPQIDVKPIGLVVMDATLALALLPVLALVLRLGTEIHQLPFRHLERSAGTRLRLLQTVSRVQPELRAMAERVSQAATEVAASATEQAAVSEELSKATTELHQLLTSAASAAADAQSAAEGTRKGSAETGESLDAVEAELQRFMGAMEGVAASVKTLAQRSAGTEGVIATVEEVHDAVKVLALNASIEAARSGEAGRGIAVVAAEMRSMIAGTEASVQEGRELLGAVRAEADATTARATGAVAELRRHAEALRRSRELVAGMLDGFGQTTQSLATIASSGEAQRQQVEIVTRAMREMQRSAADLSQHAAQLLEETSRFAAAQNELSHVVEASAPEQAA